MVAVSQEETHRLVHLSGECALAQLAKLRDASGWEVNGFSITEQVTMLRLADSGGRGKRKKKGTEEPADEVTPPKAETIDQEVMRLTPEEAGSRSVVAMELGAFSVSLAVKDIEASRLFYEELGFAAFAGHQSQNRLIRPV